MDVDVCGRVPADAWEELVAADPASTCFHSLEWARLVESTVSGLSTIYVTARRKGRLLGAIPLMTRRVNGAFTLASMPFGTYGGVITDASDPSEVTAMLFGRFREMARGPRVAYANLVDFSGRIARAGYTGGWPRIIEAHVLDLTPGYDVLLAGFSPSNRNKIRRARRSDVRVRLASSAPGFLDYHSMLVDCCRRWGSPPRLTTGFFHGLSRMERPRVELWLADHEGTTVAGLLNFVHNGTVMNWGSVSLPAGRRLGAHNLLHASAIEAASRQGASLYNFGANPGLPGVTTFKASFGTQTRPYHAYRMEKPWYLILRGGRRR